MESSQWINPHQPQTLTTGVILCYIQGVFAILSYPTLGPWAFAILVGLVAGGFGVANEKKWGYVLAVATAALQVAVVLFTAPQHGGYGNLSVLIALGFDIALVVLLTHPQSRSYQRTWFK